MLVLEKILCEKCKDATKFPRMPNKYFDQYCAFVNKLRTDIYPQIDVALAAKSKDPGYYTAHNGEHFDEVVRYAGDLLSATDENMSTWSLLDPYELYVLLVAIRVHDAGNIHGRDGHEKQCFKILLSLKSLLGDDPSELKIISIIAEAHGGNNNGDKDTIQYLNPSELVGKIKIRPRLLAAIVRFADEICENRGRAANYLIENGTLPKQSEIFHRYASSIKGVAYGFDEKRVTVKYVLTTDQVAREWGCDDRKRLDNSIFSTTYLVDEILERLEKMDRERRYCNMYTRGVYAVDSIRATVAIVSNESHDAIDNVPIPELIDTGYPDNNEPKLKEVLEAYCGYAYASKFVVPS